MLKHFFLLKIFAICTWYSISTPVYSMDVDEKLTVRVLSLSGTKKTALINRGLEDGLVVGDHAKFFLTTGVVARGVVVKASPSRSIWSLYRLVNPQELDADKVMNIKIASPVKLTDDPTKMMAESHSDLEAGSEVITVSGARGDVSPEEVAEEGSVGTSSAKKSRGNTVASSDELDELESVKGKGMDSGQSSEDIPVVHHKMKAGVNYTRTLEVWGLAHMNGLSTSTDIGNGGSSSGKQSFMDFSIGLEKYFAQKDNWLHQFSLNAIIHNTSQELNGLENGDALQQSSFEFGGGVHWHFYEDCFAYGRPIPFLGFSFGFGNTSDSADITSTGYSESFKGTSSFLTLAVGGKFYLSNGIGIRAVFDYYRRSEKYVVENTDANYAKVVSGPRLMAGISYRW